MGLEKKNVNELIFFLVLIRISKNYLGEYNANKYCSGMFNSVVS